MKKYSFTIENEKGDSLASFEITIDENREIAITETKDCSLADVDVDYIFRTENPLFRIQAD